MASSTYRKSMVLVANGEIDFTDDNFKVMLVVDYSFSQSHDFIDDVSGSEVSGVGYDAGGKAVDLSVTEDTDNDCAKITSDAITWATATITADGAVLYQVLGGDPDADPVIAYYDFGGDKSSSGADFVLTPDADGWLSLGKSA